MKKTIYDTCNELKTIVARAYEEGVTMQEAERLASLTLSIRLELADELKSLDLDSRMKKHGAKVTRSDAYLEEIKKHEKKPVESFLEATLNMNSNVIESEQDFMKADVQKEYAENLLDIFKDAHIYFRGVAKGNYE